VLAQRLALGSWAAGQARVREALQAGTCPL
jgi:hypothetical protein